MFVGVKNGAKCRSRRKNMYFCTQKIIKQTYVMKKILIVGAGGQIGSELTMHLRSIYGNNNVVACDLKPNEKLGENQL